jgi:hypothetical protein
MQAPMAARMSVQGHGRQDQQSMGGGKTGSLARCARPGCPGQGNQLLCRVMQNVSKHQVDSVAEPIQRNYQSLIQQLRNQNAVG